MLLPYETQLLSSHVSLEISQNTQMSFTWASSLVKRKWLQRNPVLLFLIKQSSSVTKKHPTCLSWPCCPICLHLLMSTGFFSLVLCLEQGPRGLNTHPCLTWIEHVTLWNFLYLLRLKIKYEKQKECNFIQNSRDIHNKAHSHKHRCI